jgi:transcriptional regulator with XRE-family HTH domain
MSTRGDRIKQALQARRIRKQHALASALKVHESAITRWKEDGNLSLENAIALCQELDVSADWLLLGLGHMDQHKSNAISTASNISPPTDALSELQSLLTQQSMTTLLSFIKSITE